MYPSDREKVRRFFVWAYLVVNLLLCDSNFSYFMGNISIEAIELVQYQEDFLYCDQLYSLVMASSKAGKTQPHIAWLLELACNQNAHYNWDSVEDKEFWWVAPVGAQARIAFKRYKTMLKDVHGFKMWASRGTERIQTPLGSWIMFKSADNPDTLYGEDVYGAVFDEISRSKRASFTALASTTGATEGPLKCICNYKGDANWFSKLYRDKVDDPNYYTATINAIQAVEAGVMTQKSLDNLRSLLPKGDFEELYMCKGGSDSYKVFDFAKICNLDKNNYVKRNNSPTRYMCCDLAYLGVDQFVVHVWEGDVLKKRYSFEKTGGRSIVAHIKKIQSDWGVLDENIVVDGTGADWLKGDDEEEGYLDGVVFFKGGSKPFNDDYYNLRSECYYKAAYYVRQGLWHIEDEEAADLLVDELDAQRRKDSSNGRIQLEKKAVTKLILGRSCDDADCFSMRAYFIVSGEGVKVEDKGSTGWVIAVA